MSQDIELLLKEQRKFFPAEDFRKSAHFQSVDQYQQLYQGSVANPEQFWGTLAREHLEWFSDWESVCWHDFQQIGKMEGPYVTFFSGGKLNITHNCLDRHVRDGRGEKIAYYWQGEQDEERRTLTYRQLQDEVCRLAHVLRKHGVKKGTTVTIFLPLVPELPIAMLACARIGAIHSVVFSAFSAEALKARIHDCGSKLLITADIGFHGGKVVPLKQKADEALLQCPTVDKMIVWSRGNTVVSMTSGRDFWWHEEVLKDDVSTEFPPLSLDAEDPLFILYTSGSTGKPKGVLHTTGGYSLHTHLTMKWVFDLQQHDIFWCTADIGWITGHSYVVYGPLSNGATVIMFEGTPTYPAPDRFWQVIEKYKATIFYTAPTAIRSLMRLGEEWPRKRNLSSLRLIGTVGEPINPEAWMWYHRVIGNEHCPIVDTWWQTETGGIMLTTLPGAQATKPGSAGFPLPGVVPQVLLDDGKEASPNQGGSLVLNAPWPGMLRGVYGDKKNELIQQVYFSKFPGKYFTGDGSHCDEDGYYWLLGRIDDVLNVSAHRFGTAELESALVSHRCVSEAAVVGFPHETKGQGIYCYVTLKEQYSPSELLKRELIEHVRHEISPIATPDKIHFAPALPKTRSGKIMRRILRKIAEGDVANLGDISTLQDPTVVEVLLAGREWLAGGGSVEKVTTLPTASE